MNEQMEIVTDCGIPFPFHMAGFDEGTAAGVRGVAGQTRDHALSRHATIQDEHGLHARPAAKIASIAKRAQSNVRIIKGDIEADAKSMICILLLACQMGSRVIVKIDHLSDCKTLDDIVNIVENGCGD